MGGGNRGPDGTIGAANGFARLYSRLAPGRFGRVLRVASNCTVVLSLVALQEARPRSSAAGIASMKN